MKIGSVVLLLLLITVCNVAHGELLNKFRMGNNMEKKHKNSEAAMTCDAMMAKSLVAANEATAMAQAERDQFFSDLESMTDTAQQLEQELKETTNDLTQRLFNANEASAALAKEHKEAMQALEAKWQTELDGKKDEISLLRHRSEKAIHQTQQDAVTRLEALQKQHASELKTRNDELEATKIQYDELTNAVRAEAAQNITSIRSKAEMMTKSLKEGHAKHIALLEQESQFKETKNRQLLEATRQEMKDRLKEQESTHKQQLASIEKEYTFMLSEANQEIKDLKKELKALETKQRDLETKYNAASEVSYTVLLIIIIVLHTTHSNNDTFIV
jgi:chromosome segregation ATPase